MPGLWFYVLWCVGAYLLGSLSPGDVVSRLAGVNIRELGTGNPGTVNIFKNAGPRYGVLVFLLDMATGAAATLPLFLLGLPSWARLLATGGVLAGHIVPVFWKFNGGAGGAVGMGAAFGLLPLGALIAASITGLTLLITRTPIYAVWLFFGITLVVGGLLYRDIISVLGVLLAMMAPTVKFFIQSRIKNTEDIKRSLGI